jgi:Arylsulfatase A and related enzymes
MRGSRFGAVVVAILWFLVHGPEICAAADQRPNILVIMTDDQSHETVTSDFMPNTKAMIGDEGLTCTEFFMPTPLCCPSRASFFTGQYAHTTGVRSNTDRLNEPTFVQQLRASGYFTGLIGKYLNSWPGAARPEFNYWADWLSGYINPKMNLFGMTYQIPGYATDILCHKALDFLDRVPPNTPFFLLVAPHAPHAPATPAPGDEALYSSLPNWRPPSFNPPVQSDKPNWLANTPLLSARKIAKNVDKFRLDQLRCLRSVDRAVLEILNKVQEQGKLDHTLIMYFSDNGYFWGEHRLLRKNHVYEEASRGTLVLRYPPLVSKPRTEARLIAVIDLAPTFYELAGLPIPNGVDGRSLLPLLRGASQWRDSILLEGWPGSEASRDKGKVEEENEMEAEEAGLAQEPEQKHVNQYQDYRAIRTKDYVYVETEGDKPELYDLNQDPYERRNLANELQYAEVVKNLRYRLHHENL